MQKPQKNSSFGQNRTDMGNLLKKVRLKKHLFVKLRFARVLSSFGDNTSKISCFGQNCTFETIPCLIMSPGNVNFSLAALAVNAIGFLTCLLFITAILVCYLSRNGPGGNVSIWICPEMQVIFQ